MHWTAVASLTPREPHFSGKVIILVDEYSQSKAEYTAMAVRAGPNSIVMGSTTAGADGNIAQVTLPGGLGTALSGIGVFYPDKRPTQRSGIIADVKVERTLKGIRDAVEEVIVETIRWAHEHNGANSDGVAPAPPYPHAH